MKGKAMGWNLREWGVGEEKQRGKKWTGELRGEVE